MDQQTRTYETICITKVDMPEEKFNALVERCKSAVANEGKGEWLYSDDWGKAKISYTIGKDNRGKWTYMRYKSAAAGVDEIQRGLRINEYVLRQITTRAADDGSDYEPLRANMSKELADRERMREWKDERGGPRGRGGRDFDRGDRGGDRYGDRPRHSDVGADNDADDNVGDDSTEA